MRSHYGGAKDAVRALVGKELNKAIVGVVDGAGESVGERNDSFKIFAVAAGEVVFAEADGSYLRVSVDNADKTAIIDRIFCFVDDVGG